MRQMSRASHKAKAYKNRIDRALKRSTRREINRPSIIQKNGIGSSKRERSKRGGTEEPSGQLDLFNPPSNRRRSNSGSDSGSGPDPDLS